MRQSAPRSLKHEYDLFIEDEIEAYKESISRATLLKIGDEAVAALQSGMQFSMNELLLVVEVDKIIRKRLRLPSYATWRKRELKRQKELQEFLRPEHWGLSPTVPWRARFIRRQTRAFSLPATRSRARHFISRRTGALSRRSTASLT